MRAFGRDQLPYLERAAVRSEVAPGVFTSTEFSSDHFIDLHHEMSFARDLPERIFFFAETLAETGGATPLADERAATAKFDAAILKVFEERGVLYERNFVRRSTWTGVPPFRRRIEQTSPPIAKPTARNSNG